MALLELHTKSTSLCSICIAEQCYQSFEASEKIPEFGHRPSRKTYVTSGIVLYKYVYITDEIPSVTMCSISSLHMKEPGY